MVASLIFISRKEVTAQLSPLFNNTILFGWAA